VTHPTSSSASWPAWLRWWGLAGLYVASAPLPVAAAWLDMSERGVTATSVLVASLGVTGTVLCLLGGVAAARTAGADRAPVEHLRSAAGQRPGTSAADLPHRG
jgi:hypothetical protein